MSDRDERFTEASLPTQTDPLEETEKGIVIEAPALVVPLGHTERTIEKIRTPLHLFSAYCEKPDRVSFENQEEGEEIILFLRKSQFFNIGWILFSLVLIFIPPLVYMVKGYLFPFPIPLSYMVVGFFFYYLLVATYAFVNFILWYFNAAIITNRRIVDIDFHQLVIKDVAETKLSLVQDVDFKQTGVIPNLFDHGNILVQTAGSIDNFEFFGVPKPERIVEVVNSLIGKGRVYVP